MDVDYRLAFELAPVGLCVSRNRVIVEFEGDASFLNSSEVAQANNYSGHAEIRLHPHGNAQKLLQQAAPPWLRIISRARCM